MATLKEIFSVNGRCFEGNINHRAYLVLFMANFCNGFDTENETRCFSMLSMIINHLVRRKTRTKPTIDWQLEVQAFAAFSLCESDEKSAVRQKGLRRIKIPENTRSTLWNPGLTCAKSWTYWPIFLRLSIPATAHTFSHSLQISFYWLSP